MDAYSDSTLILTLPDDRTVHNIDWLSVWCVPFRIDFGHVRIPNDLEVGDGNVEIPTIPPVEECPAVSYTYPDVLFIVS